MGTVVTAILLRFGLDALYVAASFAFFRMMLRIALNQGSLLKAHD